MYLEGIVRLPATGTTSTASPPRSRPRTRRGRDGRADGHAQRPTLRDLRLGRGLPPVRRRGVPRRWPSPSRSSAGTASGWPSRTTRTCGRRADRDARSGSAATTSASASTRATASPCWKTRWRSSRPWPPGRSRPTSRTWASQEYERRLPARRRSRWARGSSTCRGSSASSARPRPEIRLNLEMITRDPLEVPCLTPKYWATFEDLPARHLARSLTMVRDHAAEAAAAPHGGLSPAKSSSRPRTTTSAAAWRVRATSCWGRDQSPPREVVRGWRCWAPTPRHPPGDSVIAEPRR